ncbi:acid protease [Laetiporus sulphureus 93-53]|uniref:Acid protease n=1 Tax=Laetiporus sulphureus 93-53 TaxID=1314785 RepID=A0A165ERM0_9APHY|nr:acid protease [Laetiporus sulphureus 93-53]KZT07621.1 acid protease [Laetiporus sulphureus 93-53]
MLLVPLLLPFLGTAHALSVPFERRAKIHSTTVSINSHYGGNLGWTNVEDALYTATVYVQGQPFQVQIDSGSADLWLNTEGVTLDGLVDTGINATVAYVDTSAASGPIVLGNVSLGEFTVNGQAFINAPGSNASYDGIDVGLLGVGPPSLSSVFNHLVNSSYDGFPFLVNVFNLNPDEPNFITFLLSRSDFGYTEGGIMTIAELVSNYTEITNAPKLPVVSEFGWETYMDGVYINGEYYTGHSNGAVGVIAEPSKNQTLIVLDTGTALANAPEYYVDAMYKDLPGSVWNETLGRYVLPCTTKVNISMVFGSSVYPMNPIDATNIQVNDDGTFFCAGAFSATPDGAGVDGGLLDWILGDAFLRNVYSLMNFGKNFTGSGDESPYMQILSITDADEAWANFDHANLLRIAGSEYSQFANVSSSGEVASATTTYSLVTPTSTSASITSSAAAKDKLADELAASSASPSAGSSSDNSDLLRNSYIIMGLVAAVLVLLIAVLVSVVRSSRNKQYRQVPTMIPTAHFGNDKAYEPESEAFTNPYDDSARPTH